MSLHSASKHSLCHTIDNSSSYTQISSNYNQPYTDAKLILATLSNTNSLEHTPEFSLDLFPHELSWSDFLATFYKNGNGFNISHYNAGLSILGFSKQKYMSASNDYKLNLINELLKAYASKNNILENEILTHKQMQLTLEMHKLHSLSSLVGSISLPLDSALNQLVVSNQLVYTGELEHSAKVTFRIHVLIYSKTLDTSISINFNYNTSIPSYRNEYINSDHCIPKLYHTAQEKGVMKLKLNSSLLLDDIIVDEEEDEEDDDASDGITTLPSKKW